MTSQWANKTVQGVGLLLLWLTMLSPSIQAQESVENYNRFVLPTVKLSDGETCDGPNANSANIYIAAKNHGWVYAGFLYTAFLSSLDQYSAMHGGASTYQGSSDTPINTSGLFTLSACDMSYCILERIFGQMPGLFYADGSPLCPKMSTTSPGPQAISNLLRIFNIGIFCVICVVIGYALIGKGVLIGGFEGDILQKNLTFMTMTRMAVSIFSIIPIPGIGYSAMQTFMMYIALLGVGFADSTFRVALHSFLSYGAIFSFTGIQDNGSNNQNEDERDFSVANVQSLFNVSSQPSGADKYASIMSKMSCAYYKSMKQRIENFSNYDTGIENNAISSIFTSAQAIPMSDIIEISTEQTTASITNFVIKLDDFTTVDRSTSTPACGSISWSVPEGTTTLNSEFFTEQPAYFMLQALYNRTAEAMFNANQFFLTGTKTRAEENYFTCLKGSNIMNDDLMTLYTTSNHTLARPNGTICTYDESTDARSHSLEKFVSMTAPYASKNQIFWKDGCSGNCVGKLANALVSDCENIIDATPNISVKNQLSAAELSAYTFNQIAAATDPTSWVINTGSREFSQPYISDLLVLTQTQKQMNWQLAQRASINNIYANVLAQETPGTTSTQSLTLSGSMNTNSLNLMVQSMLAPFFGKNSVSFLNTKGYMLLDENLAVSANNFTTALLMIMQRLIGFHYYDPSKVMTTDWYRDEGRNDQPRAYTKCQDTYTSNCSGKNVDNCFSAMNDNGCFMNSDGMGRGLIGSTALMYNVGTENQSGTIVNYNPLADYIEIGYTILTASTYYMYINNQAMFYLYAKLAGVQVLTRSLQQALLSGIMIFARSGPFLPWCDRSCKWLLMESIKGTPTLITDVLIQVDRDRIDFFSGLGTTFILLFVPFGAILTVLLPLYPTIIFIVGVFGWVASVLEALIAGPMVAVGLCHPEGSDFLGKAEMGIGILFQTFLRPVLIVLGVFFSICMINIAFYVFSIAFATQYANLAGGTSSPLGSAMNAFDNWELVMAVVIALVMLYAYIAWELMSYCCTSMIGFSNQVLAWISSGSDSRFTSTVDILAATKGQVQSDAGSVSKSLNVGDKVLGLGKDVAKVGEETVQTLSTELRNKNMKAAENSVLKLAKNAKAIIKRPSESDMNKPDDPNKPMQKATKMDADQKAAANDIDRRAIDRVHNRIQSGNLSFTERVQMASQFGYDETTAATTFNLNRSMAQLRFVFGISNNIDKGLINARLASRFDSQWDREMTAHLNAVRHSQAEVGETVQYVKSALRPWERSPENDYVKEADPEDDERPEEDS